MSIIGMASAGLGKFRTIGDLASFATSAIDKIPAQYREKIVTRAFMGLGYTDEGIMANLNSRCEEGSRKHYLDMIEWFGGRNGLNGYLFRQVISALPDAEARWTMYASYARLSHAEKTERLDMENIPGFLLRFLKNHGLTDSKSWAARLEWSKNVFAKLAEKCQEGENGNPDGSIKAKSKAFRNWAEKTFPKK